MQKVSSADADHDLDEEAMNKAVMSRKDRNLYQSILKRQKAQKETVRKLQTKRARLAEDA